jgi:hypothetical protein
VHVVPGLVSDLQKRRQALKGKLQLASLPIHADEGQSPLGLDPSRQPRGKKRDAAGNKDPFSQNFEDIHSQESVTNYPTQLDHYQIFFEEEFKFHSCIL